MKTKKFLMLIAAMLLSCTSAFAQSGNNNNPAKGDVNEDGTVDVADIVAVIDIMKNGGGTATIGYFYLGTTRPTAENYKTLPGAVTSFSSIDDAVGTTASVTAGQTLYMLCPSEWVTGKSVALEDNSGNTVDFLDEKDATTIPDYVIYKTQVWNSADNVTLKQKQVYYWYAGQVAPTSTSTVTTTTTYDNGGGWFELGTTVPNTITQLVKGGNRELNWYAAVPITNGSSLKPVASDMTTLDNSVTEFSTITIGNISYKVYYYGGFTAARNTFSFAKK